MKQREKSGVELEKEKKEKIKSSPGFEPWPCFI